MSRRLFAISGHYSHTNCLLGNTTKLLVLLCGLETGSIVTVSTLGVRTEKELFMHGYQEMIKRVNPEAVICYGNPFDEMEGNIIAVDYAKTNNLSKWADYICGEKEIPFNSNLIVKRYGYVLNEKGMGRASGQWKPKKEDDKRFLGNQNNYQKEW